MIPEQDAQGYLKTFDAWTEQVAVELADAEGLTLTSEHWEVIVFLRQYYADFLIAPAVRVLSRALSRRLGPEKGDRDYLDRLFPAGPAKQACKIAGLPRPTGCI